MANPISAAFDLGLGDMLGQQRDDETDDERRKRKLGMSDTQKGGLFDFGRTGIASIDLALPGAGMGASGGRR